MSKRFPVVVDKKAFVKSSKHTYVESEIPNTIIVSYGDVLKIRREKNFTRLGKVKEINNGMVVTDRYRTLDLNKVICVGERHYCGGNSWLLEHKK